MIYRSGRTSAQRRDIWPSGRSCPSPTRLDSTRLAYLELIKQTIRDAVQHSEADTLTAIAQATAQVLEARCDELQALVVQELRRLHEGVLARYGLRPSELVAWKAAQQTL